MALPPSIIEQRGDQMLPVLDPLEIERVRRFGECRSFAAGEALFTIGQVGPGFIVILAGKVDVTQRDQSGQRISIVSHGPGQFMGELAQLAGRPALADATARGAGAGPAHSAGPAARAAGRGGRARRADHARADPAPRRSAGDRRRRPDHRRPRRQWRRAAAAELSAPQRSSAAIARSRHRRRGEGADRALPRRSRATADRALSRRTAAAQSERGRAGPLHRTGRADRSEPHLRRRRGRRRTGRPCRGGLCRVGRTLHPRARLPRLRRSGRRLGADRKLSRLSDRHHRPGLDGARLQSGAEVRCRNGDPGRGERAGRAE